MNLLSREAAPVFNAAMGALAAAAAAFFVFAMPAELFDSFVGGSGIAALLPAAQPPLGLTARILAMVLVGGAVFALIWAVLGRIDALDDKTAVAEDEAEPALPRLRRADAHPDAPVRRPLLAGADLGEPLDAPLGGDAGGAEPPVDDQPVEIPEFLLETVEAAEEAPPSEPAAIAEQQADEMIEQPAMSPEPMRPSAQSRSVVANEDPPLSTQELMERLPLPEDRGESISILFRRLDTGLATLEWPLRPTDPKETPPEAQDPVDDQLRSALDDLRRMAGGSSS